MTTRKTYTIDFKQEQSKIIQPQTLNKPETNFHIEPHLVKIIGLMGAGIAIVFISTVFFDKQQMSFLGVYRDEESGSVVGFFLSILLLGQYLWRYHKTIPHTVMILGLIGMGGALWYSSLIIFGSLNIGFLGMRGKDAGAFLGSSLSIFIVGKYLRRHQSIISHTAIILGLIGVEAALWVIPTVIFGSLDISFWGMGGYDSGVFLGFSLSILLISQYLWRHKKTIPHTAMLLGLIGIGAMGWCIPMIIIDLLNISFLGKYGSHESGVVVGLSLSILLIGQYLWRHKQTIPRMAMILGFSGIGIGIAIIILAISIALNYYSGLINLYQPIGGKIN